MIQKQASGGSSDSSDDGYSFGSGRRLNNPNVASTTTAQTNNSGFGPLILKPSNPEFSDILLQELSRLSEQHRRETAANLMSSNLSNGPSTSTQNTSQFLLNDRPSTSKNESSQSSQTSGSNTANSQQMELDSISNQYNTNSILPLRLSNEQATDKALRMQNLSDAANLMRSESSSTHHSQPLTQYSTNTNHDFTFPLMLQRDNHSSCLAEYQIGAHKIVGFTVGGEPRLCLPQLKALILPDCSGFDKLLSDLQIATVNASSDQLNQLVQAKALPKSVGYCPLITRSNAERLVNYCVVKGIRPLCGFGNVDNYMDMAIKQALQHEIVPIEHFCFGGQLGFYYPSLLSSSCIECSTCQRLFRPPDFVRHTHVIEDSNAKVCDWGFDVANWKFYIVLGESAESNEVAAERLRQLLAFPYDLTSQNLQSTTFSHPLQLSQSEPSTSAILGQPHQQPVQS
ncbi:Ski oncogene [Aphelenchoides bicaudatus]|nr:Ski oncogene [Aphelenchoides bicaudatus]